MDQELDNSTELSEATPIAEQQAETKAAPVEDAANESTGEAQAQEPKAEAERDEKGRFKGVQPRIDELTRARREAEREAAYWREIANGKGGSAEAAKTKPTPDQYSDYGEFVEALTDWKADQAVASRLQQRAQAQQQEARATTWSERQAEARAAMPDYDAVVGGSDTPIAPHVAEVIVESDKGPALAYHLARNPESLMRLNGMSPLQAAREAGRIEASLTAQAPQAAPVVKTTNAPKPASTSSSQGRTTSIDPNKMSMDEYVTWRKSNGARWAR